MLVTVARTDGRTDEEPSDRDSKNFKTVTRRRAYQFQPFALTRGTDAK